MKVKTWRCPMIFTRVQRFTISEYEVDHSVFMRGVQSDWNLPKTSNSENMKR